MKPLLLKKKILISIGIIILLMSIVTINKPKVVNEVVENEPKATEQETKPAKILPKETLLVEMLKYDNNGTKLVIDFSEDIDLRLSSEDDIIITSINKTTNEVLTSKNKSLKSFLIDENGNDLGSEDDIAAGTYSAIFEAYELGDQPIENIVINLSVIKDNKEIHNSNISYTRFGKDGHVDIKSVASNPIDFGTKFKWEVTNPTTDKRTNIKITTLDETQVLASIDINPMETINVLTDSTKGTRLKLHTMQGDNTYMVKEINVDKNMIKYEDVLVEYIEPDVNSYGNMLRYKVKNQNSNGIAHVVIKDSAGAYIMEFSLDTNNQKVINIDVNRGKSIIVETKMADGSYSTKKYNMPKFEEKHVSIESSELVENNSAGIMKIEIDNIVEGRTNVIVCTSDEVANITQFDMNAGEKRIVDINLDYVQSIMIKTKQVDGSYASKIYNIAPPEVR